jgi:lysophospholipase L1-like esterase
MGTPKTAWRNLTRAMLKLTLLEDRCLRSTVRPFENAAEPQPGRSPYWAVRHEELLTAPHSSSPDVILLGDSITDWWRTVGSQSWNSHFSGIKADNFGIAGNLTQQVLWQLSDGELSGVAPKVTVLMIGTNNLSVGESADEVAQGIATLVGRIEAAFPSTKVLLFGILPRGAANDPLRQKITEVNSSIMNLADGKRVAYRDIGGAFLQADGSISAGLMMADRLHPTAAGYDFWAGAMEKTLSQLLATQAIPAWLYFTPASLSSQSAITAVAPPIMAMHGMPMIRFDLPAADTHVTTSPDVNSSSMSHRTSMADVSLDLYFANFLKLSLGLSGI